MATTLTVRVIGFSDVERHSLKTLLRLSEGREMRYDPWQGGGAPDLVLIDGESYEAVVEFESPSNAALKMVWIGRGQPARAVCCFERPVNWADVVAAMDGLFQPQVAVDLDITAPAPLGGADRHLLALIASPDRDHRLYLRARLALSGLTQADEAETAADALELARRRPYDVALVDLAWPAGEGWALARRLRAGAPPIRHLIVTHAGAGLAQRIKAWMARVLAVPGSPPNSARLKALLDRV